MADHRTTSEDFGRWYFESYADGDYQSEVANWAQFFGGVADKLIGLFRPERVLDVGCAKGFLVEAFVDRDIDATGIDISTYAIAEASETIKDRLTVGSLTAPIEGRYDLITCFEVLEHMDSREAEIALVNLAAATDRVVFSSTPRHFDDPTHVNVMQPAEWAARYAEQGFFRRIDVDLRFISPWAVVFERRAMSPRDVVFAYESLQWPLRDEAAEKRQALLEKERLLSIELEKTKRFDELGAEVERRQVANDELVAEVERRQVANDELVAEVERLSTAIDAVTEDRHAISAERDSLQSKLTSLRAKVDRLPGWVRWLGRSIYSRSNGDGLVASLDESVKDSEG